MNIEKFRSDLKAVVGTKVTQVELERLSGVRQSTISKIINATNKDINLSTALKLWPFIYGCEFAASPQGVTNATR